MNKKYCLVLGAGGMIGHQLTNYLVGNGYWVRGVDLKYPEFSESKAQEFIVADLRNPLEVSRVMFAPLQTTLKDENTFDIVFQLAAQMGGALYVFTREFDSDIIHDSLLINLNVANYASKFGVKKLFFSSSACCYPEKIQGKLNSPALQEWMAWEGKPDSVYGVEKLISEDIYDSFRRNKGLNIRIGRFHNIFSTECTYKGGREKYPAAICRKISEANDGDEIEVFGDGKNQRSFLWIDECIEGVMKLIESDYPYPFNIGSDELISVNDLANMVIEISGKNLTIKNVESNALGVRGRNSDNTLIKELLGWSPSKPLREGIEKLYNWVNNEVQKQNNK